MITKPENAGQALALALALAITAPTDEKAAEAVELADGIAAGMTAEEVAAAKDAAEELAAGIFATMKNGGEL